MKMIQFDDDHGLGSNNSDRLKHARDHKIKNMKRYYQHLKIKNIGATPIEIDSIHELQIWTDILTAHWALMFSIGPYL